MAEIKDKVVTVESLSALHEYNKETYMPTWVDLGVAPIQYNPSEFVSFVAESTDDANNEVRYIAFTDTTSNSSTLDTHARTFEFDDAGNMKRHELYFYWGEGGYMVDATTSQFSIGTEETESSSLPYNKIYGIKYV